MAASERTALVPAGPPRAGASSRATGNNNVAGSPTSPSHRTARAPVRIASPPEYVLPASAAAVPAAVHSAPISSATHLTAHERAERGRILDDEFRLRRDRSDDDDQDSTAPPDDTDTNPHYSQQPFLAHSYQSASINSSTSSQFESDGNGLSPDPELADGTAINSSKDAVRAPLGRWAKLLMLPCAILLSVANSITWKRMLNRYASIDGTHRNLEFFVNQWTLLIYLVACIAVLVYRWCFTNLITPEQRAYPKRRFAVMGALDAVAGLFAAVGGSVTAGQVQLVINQANIPVTMAMSRVYLKQLAAYTWSQYVGAGVIIAGGLVSALGTAGDPEGQHALWYGSLLIFLSVLPGAMSNVYKEENFKQYDLDVFYLSTYVSVWQGIMSFACVPLFSLSYFGGIPMSEMPQNLYDGYRCFFGHHLDGYECENPSPSSASLLLLFVVANFLYNLVLLMMVKHGSALFLVVACAMALPLTNLVYTQEWLMGEDVEEFSHYNFIGLILAVLGFLLYSNVQRTHAPAEGEAEEPAGVAKPRGEFMIPPGPAAGFGLYITEYFPSVSELDYYHSGAADEYARERRHSFDFHSSPSVRRIQDVRKKRLQKKMQNKTPSRTP